MTDERVYLTFDEAEGFLSDKVHIHTFRNGSGMLIGADWSRLPGDTVSPSWRQAAPDQTNNQPRENQ